MPSPQAERGQAGRGRSAPPGRSEGVFGEGKGGRFIPRCPNCSPSTQSPAAAPAATARHQITEEVPVSPGGRSPCSSGRAGCDPVPPGPQRPPRLLARPGRILAPGAGQERGARALQPPPAAPALPNAETPSPITATEGRRCEGDLCPVHPAVRGHPRPPAPSGPHKHLERTRSRPRKGAGSPGKAEPAGAPGATPDPSITPCRMCAAPAGIPVGIFPSAPARTGPVPGSRCGAWPEAACCWGTAEAPGASWATRD